MIQSKAGLQQKADVIIKKNTDLLRDISASQRNVKCILVDEVHQSHECRSWNSTHSALLLRPKLSLMELFNP